MTTSSSYSKRISGTCLNMLKKLAGWALLGILLYGVFFVIVIQIYAFKMARFDKKITRIYEQLQAQNQEKTLALFPDREALFSPEKPTLLDPGSVVSSLFSFERIHSEGVQQLKHFILSFKENLSGIDLSEVDLSGKEMDFSGANLSHANLRRVNFSNANLSKAILNGADLRDAELSGVNLSHAVLVGADLSRAELSAATLLNADLTRALLREARINGADLSGVNLFFADLSGVILRESKLVGADLSGVALYHADLIAVDLSRARLTGADLDGADLRFANLSTTIGLKQNQLDRGIVDEKTKLPLGLIRSKVK